MTPLPLVLRSVSQQIVIELDEPSIKLEAEDTVLSKTSTDPALVELTVQQERPTL